MGQGPRHRHETGEPRGRLGACLSAPRRRRSRQCRLLVSPRAASRAVRAGRGGMGRGRGGADRRGSGEGMSVAATNGKLIKGATGDWEVVIGMEVHAQVTSNAKLFSG